jgi:hypothetical protein
MEERRRFDRVLIPLPANIFADDDQGNRLGRIRELGRGGFLLQTSRRFSMGVPLAVIIVAEHDGIRRQVNVVQRYRTAKGETGFEFHALEPEAAVEIGVLIGKYYDASAYEK